MGICQWDLSLLLAPRLHSLLLISMMVVEAQKVVPSTHLGHFLIDNLDSQRVCRFSFVFELTINCF